MQVAQNTCKIKSKLVPNQTFGKAAQAEAGTRAYLRIIDDVGFFDSIIRAAENFIPNQYVLSRDIVGLVSFTN